MTAEHRGQVERDVATQADFNIGFILLVLCASGIATLGLLQSSTAVVIGAMLISPLMGPISAMGMGVARFDFAEFRRAGLTLAIGAALSVAAAAFIVAISPLKDVTTEILARTRPTLLDLIIAALSGVVGGFVTMTRRGGVIAGVAIATALMPPLAVVGFGLATGSMAIAAGAFLLFVTNVIAILLAIFAVARLFGFMPARTGHRVWETVVICCVVAALSAPLVFSLSDIVAETRQTSRVRTDLSRLFAARDSRVSDLKVSINDGAVSEIDAIVVTKKYLPDAEATLRRQYPKADVVNIEQVLAADDQTLLAGLRRSASRPETQADGLDPDVRALLARKGTLRSARTQDGVTDVGLDMSGDHDVGVYHDLEDAINRLSPARPVHLVPPPMALPPVRFAPNSSALDEAAARQAEVDAWAMRRWGLETVTVIGSAPRGYRLLAQRRAQAVADLLSQSGYTVDGTAISETANGDTGGAEMRGVPAAPEPAAAETSSSSAS